MTSASPLRETRFVNPRLATVGVDLLRLSELFSRIPATRLSAPERLQFCLVLVVASGRGEHLVDFERVALRPGVAVVVRPGAVQQWVPRPGIEGDVLLIEGQLLPPAHASSSTTEGRLRIEAWPSAFQLSKPELAQWNALAAMLRTELARPEVDDLTAALARALTQCLLLGLARRVQCEAGRASAHDLTYRQMERELERLVATRPTVATLAGKLRVSPSTLNRACQARLGLSAKAVIDRRVALEAQRLLVHTQATAAAISDLLSFSEPTNFVKFFKRRVGVAPDQFRRAQKP
jgi:AraC-like DNA-binding protein